MHAGLNVDVIKLLLDRGADHTLENNFGISPLKMYEAYPDILNIFKERMHKQ
jgi:hypothetical protein